jgi:GT2 family glycosyltransferase
VLLDLLRGRFEYRDLGILDRTHLRFFTRDSITRLLAECGYAVVECHPIRVEIQNSEFKDRASAHPVDRVGQELLEMPDALAYQWVLRAIPHDRLSAVAPREATLARLPALETRLYWRSSSDGYSEERSAAAQLPAGGGPFTVELEIAPGEKNSLRWDPLDRPAILRVEELVLSSPDREIWRAVDALLRAPSLHEVVPLGTSGVAWLLALGPDPWLELAVPGTVLDQLRQGGKMSVKMAFHVPDEARAAFDEEQARVAGLRDAFEQVESSLTDGLRAVEARMDQFAIGLGSTTATIRTSSEATAAGLEDLVDSSRRLLELQQRTVGLLEQISASNQRRLPARIRRGWDKLLGRGYRFRRELMSRRYTFTPVPAAQLMRLEGARWVSLGRDPQFELRPDSGKYPYGLVRVHCAVRSADDQVANLYFDVGNGFREAERLSMPSAGGPIAVRLPEGMRRLRLDPRISPGEFVLEEFWIEEISYTGAVRDAALSKLANFTGRPSSLVPEVSLRDLLRRGPGLVSRGRGEGPGHPKPSYQEWARAFAAMSSQDRDRVVEAVDRWAYRPRISVVMPVWNTPERFLRRAVESVIAQVYPEWELCVVDDASTSAAVTRVLTEYSESDPRIRILRRERNGHISRASNDGVAMASGEFVTFLDHDDELAPEALAQVVHALNQDRELDLIYTDEDKIDAEGRRFDPNLKPDWSPERLLAQNYVCHLCVYRTEVVRAVGGLRDGYEGSQDHDLVLRVSARLSPERIRHLPFVLYHWRSIPGSTAAAGSEKPYAAVAGLRAVRDALAAAGTPASADHGTVPNTYRITRQVQGSPLVSIIIPTRDQVELLRQCVDSIRHKTSYRNFELVVVDNESSSPDAVDYFREIEDSGVARVLRYPHPFNYSAINNFAARSTQGEVVALLNNDIEVISGQWLSEMLALVLSPGVGAVGAKLLYPNGHIQHAGVVGGLFGVAGHMYKHEPQAALGAFGELTFAREVLAVTAACMLVKRRVWDEVSGLNERDLAVAFNDVDFCFRLRKLGYRNLWTPHAELVHHESVSRGSDDRPARRVGFRAEIEYMKKTWPEFLRADPYHSPNLSLESHLQELAWPPRVRPFFRGSTLSEAPQAPRHS